MVMPTGCHLPLLLLGTLGCSLSFLLIMTFQNNLDKIPENALSGTLLPRNGEKH